MATLVRNQAHETGWLDEVLARVRALEPDIRARARETEDAGRVSADMMALLRATGALDLTKPRRFGGLELGPHALILLGHAIGRACGSTAWCASLANCNAWFASFWPIKAQEDIWGNDPAALVAGVAVPTGKVERVAGGYSVSGKFPFASNCDNSQWVFLSGALPAGDGGPAVTTWLMVPRDELEIDHASWRVSGLQGTGSKTVSRGTPLFVPAHRALSYDDVAANHTPGAADPANRMARFGYSTFGAAALVGPMLGMAQGALDWFVETMGAKVRAMLRSGTPLSVASSPFVQARIGAASAGIEAALALLLRDLAAAEATIAAGESLGTDQRVAVRRALGFAARQAVSVTNMLTEAAGASAAAIDTPIQRLWRDVNTAGRHVSLDPQAIEALVGQERLGIPLTGTY